MSTFEEMGTRGLGRDTVLRSPFSASPELSPRHSADAGHSKAQDGLIPVAGLSSGLSLGGREVCRRFTAGPLVGGAGLARADPDFPAHIGQSGGWPPPEGGMARARLQRHQPLILTAAVGCTVQLGTGDLGGVAQHPAHTQPGASPAWTSPPYSPTFLWVPSPLPASHSPRSCLPPTSMQTPSPGRHRGPRAPTVGTRAELGGQSHTPL